MVKSMEKNERGAAGGEWEGGGGKELISEKRIQLHILNAVSVIRFRFPHEEGDRGSLVCLISMVQHGLILDLCQCACRRAKYIYLCMQRIVFPKTMLSRLR